MKLTIPRILIHVKNGTVQTVQSDAPVTVYTLDRDAIAAGDPFTRAAGEAPVDQITPEALDDELRFAEEGTIP